MIPSNLQITAVGITRADIIWRTQLEDYFNTSKSIRKKPKDVLIFFKYKLLKFFICLDFQYSLAKYT